MASRDIVTQIALIKKEIEDIVKKGNGSTVSYDMDDSSFKAYTLNPVHNSVFLLYEVVCDKKLKKNEMKLKALRLILNFVKNTTKSTLAYSYTVKWRNLTDIESGQHTSYFNVTDIEELAKKFYVKKNKHDYVIDNIKLNPIS